MGTLVQMVQMSWNYQPVEAGNPEGVYVIGWAVPQEYAEPFRMSDLAFKKGGKKIAKHRPHILECCILM